MELLQEVPDAERPGAAEEGRERREEVDEEPCAEDLCFVAVRGLEESEVFADDQGGVELGAARNDGHARVERDGVDDDAKEP